MSGKLYLVATPIGNLEDITLRAINVLKEVDYIAAEDTRHTLGLLNALEIAKPMISYHRHNEEVRCDKLVQILKEGKNVALVSDAGTPVISDPGEEIVKQCIQESIEVIPIPGPCALVTALISSGLNAKEFTFLGFLPMNKKLRKQKLQQIENSPFTILLYEAPHKIQTTLKDLEPVIQERKIVVAKELTKIHEQFFRGTISEILPQLQNAKGEYVIVIEAVKQKQEEVQEEISLEQQYEIYKRQGMEKKEIIKQIAKDRKVSKNEIYQQFIQKE